MIISHLPPPKVPARRGPGSRATYVPKSAYRLVEDTIKPDDVEDLIGWLRGDPWLTQGPLVKQFETQWARWLGCDHAVYVNSGSSANLLMYYALLASGRLKNRKVVVPAVSWATTVAPAIQLGFEPILCEADPEHFGLDLDHLERLLKLHDPGAVIAVHVLGVPNDLDRLISLRSRHGFALMEDACAATGSKYRGRLVGTFGELSSFSFYYGHHMSTVEGGMVCTSDPELRDMLVQLRSHGWAKDLAPEVEARKAQAHRVIDFNRPFTFYQPGFNVRSSDLNARIGLSQMERLDDVVARRCENHAIYQERFSDAEDWSCQRNPHATICSISFAALAASEAHRATVARELSRRHIETRPLGGGNMSRQPFWQARYGSAVMPVADRIHTACLQLPNHPGLTPDDVHFICDTVLGVAPA